MREYNAFANGKIFKSESYSDLIVDLWNNSDGNASIDLVISSSRKHLQVISRNNIVKKAIKLFTESFRKNIKVGDIAYFNSKAIGVVFGTVTLTTSEYVYIKCSDKLSLLVGVDLIFPEKTISLF